MFDHGSGSGVERRVHYQLNVFVLFAKCIKEDDCLINIGASKAHDNWYANLHLDRCVHNALSDCIALHDTSKDVYKNGFHLRVLAQNLKGGLDLMGVGATTDVEEVGSFASMQRDDVHSCHCKTCTIDHATDVSVESNVVETSLNCLIFVGIIVSC